MIRKRKIIVLVILCAVILTGCVAARHAINTQEGLQGDRLTVGTVQKEIRKGMSGAEVAVVLGSQNIDRKFDEGDDISKHLDLSKAK